MPNNALVWLASQLHSMPQSYVTPKMPLLRKSTVYLVFFYILDAGEPTSGSISQKIFRNRKNWGHFFLLLFYPLQLCHWTFSLKINIDELSFFFLFFCFWDSFFKGVSKKCILCADEFPKLLTQSILVGFTQKNKQCD